MDHLIYNDLDETSKQDEDDWSEQLTQGSAPRPPLQGEVLQELQKR